MRASTPAPSSRPRIRRGVLALLVAVATAFATLAGGALPASADTGDTGGAGIGSAGSQPAHHAAPHPKPTAPAPAAHSTTIALPPSSGASLTSYSLSGTVKVPSGTPSGWWNHVVVEVAPNFDSNACLSTPSLCSSPGGSAAVSPTGGWQVNGLLSGHFTVLFRVDGQVNLATQFYNGKTRVYQATDVVIASASKTGINATLKKGRVVSGTVTLPAEADPEWLNGVSVELGPIDSVREGADDASTLTVPVNPTTGRYAVQGVPSSSSKIYGIHTVVHSYDLGDGPVGPGVVGGFWPDNSFLAPAEYPNPDAFSLTANKTVNFSLVPGEWLSGTVTLSSALPDGATDQNGRDEDAPGFTLGYVESLPTSTTGSAIDPAVGIDGSVLPTGAIPVTDYDPVAHTASYAGSLPAGPALLRFENEVGSYLDDEETYWGSALESQFYDGSPLGVPLGAHAPAQSLAAYSSHTLDWHISPASYASVDDVVVDLPQDVVDVDDGVDLTVGSAVDGIVYDRGSLAFDDAADADGSNQLDFGTQYVQVPYNASGWALTASAVDYGYDSDGTEVFDAAQGVDDIAESTAIAGGIQSVADTLELPQTNLRTGSFIVNSLPKNQFAQFRVTLYQKDGSDWDAVSETDAIAYNSSKSTKNEPSSYAFWNLPAGTYTIGIAGDAGTDNGYVTTLQKSYAPVFLGQVASLGDPALSTFTITAATDTVRFDGLTISPVAAFTAPTPVVTSTGSPTAGVPGDVLTVDAGTWTPTPTSTSVQWYRGSSKISGATHATYTLTTSDGGKSITAKVTGTRSGYTSKTVTSNAIAVSPTFTTAPTPTISGHKTPGAVLTVNPHTTSWRPTAGVLTEEWYVNGVDTGVSGLTYTVSSDNSQLGPDHAITVKVTDTKAGVTSRTVTSAAFVVPAAFTLGSITANPGALPVIGSTASVQFNGVTPIPTSVKYQWYRGASKISGATKSQYTIGSKDAGKTVWAKATISRSGYVTTTLGDATDGFTVWGAFTHVPTLKITGTPAPGQTLTAAFSGSTWLPTLDDPFPVFVWFRNGQEVGDGSTYALTSADLQSTITVKVVAAAGSGSFGRVLTSSGVKVGKPFTVFEVSERETGDQAVGTTLHAVVTVSPSATLKYQWLRDGAPISGATHSSYLLVAADSAHTITLRVTGSRSGYATTIVDSLDGGILVL